MEPLKAVLGRLKQECLKAKLEKCTFFKPEVNYLGYIICRDDVSTDPGKIKNKSLHPRVRVAVLSRIC